MEKHGHNRTKLHGTVPRRCHGPLDDMAMLPDENTDHMIAHESPMVVAVGTFPPPQQAQPPKTSEPLTLGSAPPATVGSDLRVTVRRPGPWVHKLSTSRLRALCFTECGSTEPPAQRAGHLPTLLHV